MNDHELDTLVARTATISDAEIARWVHDVPFDNLCEAIMTTTSDIETAPSGVAQPDNVLTLRQGRRWRRVGVLATAAAAITATVFAVATRGGGHESEAWAAPLVQFAQRSPLLLIGDDAWHVTQADESAVDEGEMTFVNGAQMAELNWRPGPLGDWLADRKDEGTDRGVHPVVNGSADVIQYDGTQSFTALWSADERVLELRVDSTTAEDFGALLDQLVVVDTETWLQAMPASVIAAADQQSVVTEMLAGIPLPSGFDAAALAADVDLQDRYQLGAQVVSAVSCAWIGQWVASSAAGDTSAASAAVDAMASSSGWPVLQEMAASGDYPKVLQSLVDEMVAGGPAAGGKGSLIDHYRDALGCDPEG